MAKKIKLYRYRPLSEILFKELRYSEIYFASPEELNDPLDLNGRLNFYSDNEEKTRAIARFLAGRMFVALFSSGGSVSERDKAAVYLLRSNDLEQHMSAEFSKCTGSVVTKSQLFEILLKFVRDNGVIDKSSKELLESTTLTSLDEIFSQFLSSSSVACFSSSCSNFLMWSHYASGHTGLCLEFEVEIDPAISDLGRFPMVSHKPIDGKFIKWTIDVEAVQYKDALSRLDFYDYLRIFNNVGDVDLMTLSKSYWHPYAGGIKKLFLEKLRPWCDEKEWRIVLVRFCRELPDERLLKFNHEALTGVYFGAKASRTTKARVRKILDTKAGNPKLYNCSVDGTRGVVAVLWEDADYDDLEEFT